jgi:carboxymethylenebutenolidase
VSASILTHTIGIPVGGGGRMGAFVARPPGGPSAAVIVAGELFGVSAHVRAVCERLAEAGYVALAPDLHHRTAPGVELPENQQGRERGFELLKRMTREQVLADLGAALDWLHANGSARVAMLGLSLGGHMAYLAAATLDLEAVAIAYGGWIPTTDIPLSQPQPTLTLTPKITAPLLYLVGERDHVIPPEHRRAIAAALRDADVRHTLVEYQGVGHGFLNERRDAYDPAAARDAWQRIEELFKTARRAPAARRGHNRGTRAITTVFPPVGRCQRIG